MGFLLQITMSCPCALLRQPAGAGARGGDRLPVLVLGAGCRCWCFELAVHVVETGCRCWCWCAGAGAGAGCPCWCCELAVHVVETGCRRWVPGAGCRCWCWCCGLAMRVVETVLGAGCRCWCWWSIFRARAYGGLTSSIGELHVCAFNLAGCCCCVRRCRAPLLCALGCWWRRCMRLGGWVLVVLGPLGCRCCVHLGAWVLVLLLLRALVTKRERRSRGSLNAMIPMLSGVYAGVIYFFHVLVDSRVGIKH